MVDFANIISLGYFCGPALELEKVGLRSHSYPFDWLISDFEEILSCIENGFKNFLTYENLYQYKNIKYYYYDKKYKMHFYHDFDEFRPLKIQLEDVKEKYNRRIERFYKDITKPTLFIRYVKDQHELDYITQNYESVIELLKKYHGDNNLLLIANDDLVNVNQEVYFVSKDANDVVARRFLEKNDDLKKYLNSAEVFDELERKRNLAWYKCKEDQKKIVKIKDKISKKFKKKYKHQFRI